MAELYRRHHPAVLRYASTCCRDPHTAEDLAAEAFALTLAAVRSGAGPREAWRPYLFVVVRNTAATWADTARRTALTDDFDTWIRELPLTDPDESAEERVARLEEGSVLLRGFRSLPERWQAVLWYTSVEGESAAEAGRLLGVGASGVTSLAARAREGLRLAYLTAYAELGGSRECRRYSAALGAAVRRPGKRSDRRLDRHLDECAPCRGAARELADINSRLAAVLPAGLLLWTGASRLFGETVGAATAGAATAKATGVAAKGGPAGAVPTAVGAGVCAVAVIAGAALLWPGGGPPAPAPAPASAPSASAPRTPEPVAPTLGAPLAAVTAAPSRSPSPSSSPSRVLRVADTDRTRLRVAATGRCVQAAEAEGAEPAEAACDGADGQLWDVLVPDSEDPYDILIRNVASGLCLANAGIVADGSDVSLRPCDTGAPRQQWLLYQPEGKEEARFIARNTRKMYLGLTDWWEAETGKPHRSEVSTSHHYYASPSFGFLTDGPLFAD
ncbi:sigma-70 family RNA polymerase sigma factor [Streptomyces griseus]|uniref:sigma-70 family RNA polymerase sigma factor n=1 Tax=Streptomyces griseus TaxID=1911 RepID=UPI0033D70AF7